MFLSLHVKFIWFQVVLMLDIGPRHVWELLLSILLSLVYFYFEVTKKIQKFSEGEKCLGKCSKVVPQGSKDPGLQCVMLMKSHQETL